MNVNKERKQRSAIHATITRIVLVTIVGGLLLNACGAEEPKVYRVGVLIGVGFAVRAADSLKAEMAELGYVEGENIVYDVQITDFDMAAYQRVVEKFVADKVDLIFVIPTEAALVAKATAQGTDIPVVFTTAMIEGNGLVDSVREPGGNITGARFPQVDISLKIFETLHELDPEAKRYWMPYQRGYGSVTYQLEALYPAAKAAGVTLIEAPADNAAELEADLQERAQADDVGFDAIMLLVDPLSVTPDVVAVLSEFSAEHKIPIGGGMVVEENYGPVFEVNAGSNDAKIVAPLVDQVLKGTPAGTIPVVSPETELKINYKVAQELGLTVPESLLLQAQEIIR